MAESVFLAELSWPAYKKKIEAGAVVIFPVGATEQHGPHLALNVDVVIPTGVAERVAKAIGGLVAPTLPYGYKSQPRSGGGEAFPGTTSLDGNTFALVVRDVIRGLGRDGVRRIVVLNGHFENMWPSVEGVDLGLRELKRDGIADMQLMRLEYWDFIRRSTLDKLFPEGFPGHRARACEPARDLADAAAAAGPRRHEQGSRRRAGEVPDLRPASGSRRFRAGVGRAGAGGARVGREGPVADRRPRRADRRRHPQRVQALRAR